MLSEQKLEGACHLTMGQDLKSRIPYIMGFYDQHT